MLHTESEYRIHYTQHITLCARVGAKTAHQTKNVRERSKCTTLFKIHESDKEKKLGEKASKIMKALELQKAQKILNLHRSELTNM
jgi:hypothetical protein